MSQHETQGGAKSDEDEPVRRDGEQTAFDFFQHDVGQTFGSERENGSDVARSAMPPRSAVVYPRARAPGRHDQGGTKIKNSGFSTNIQNSGFSTKTVGSVPKFKTVVSVPKFKTVVSVPKFKTVVSVQKFETVVSVPKIRNSGFSTKTRNRGFSTKI